MNKQSAGIFTDNVTKVSDATVQKVHDKTMPSTKRGVKSRRTTLASHKLSLVRVNPAVLQIACELARGDAKRIQVISTTEVIVHNHPYGWK